MSHNADSPTIMTHNCDAGDRLTGMAHIFHCEAPVWFKWLGCPSSHGCVQGLCTGSQTWLGLVVCSFVAEWLGAQTYLALFSQWYVIFCFQANFHMIFRIQFLLFWGLIAVPRSTNPLIQLSVWQAVCFRTNRANPAKSVLIHANPQKSMQILGGSLAAFHPMLWSCTSLPSNTHLFKYNWWDGKETQTCAFSL